MIHYQIRKDEGRLWLEETTYDPKYELKTESVFSQSNGKIGIRGVHDFKVLGENRGMFIGGLYQKAYESEVTELVNCPDLTEIVLNVQGEIFSLDRCVIHEYKRSLDLKTGELVIKYHCKLKNGLEILIRSQRFVSYADNEFICQKLVITPLNKSIEELTLKTGINGQITNSGVSHFQQIDCRVYDKKYIEMKGYLKEDTIQLMCGCMVSGENFDGDLDFVLSRRKISGIYKGGIKQKQSLCFTKYMFVRNEIIDLPLSNKLASYMDESYEDHFRSHCRKMADYLKYANIHIDGATL